VIGPGEAIRIPPGVGRIDHEAELGLVIGKRAHRVARANAWSYILGLICVNDVTARDLQKKESQYTRCKGFDTFAPIGPCITTADEIPDPNNVIVRFWNDGQLRHNYNTDDMEHRVPELVEFASSIMTLNSGDLIACGTNHEGLGALQDGERVEIEVQHVGRMALNVVDRLKRTWEKGVYMGADSTNPEAVKRHRPQG